MPQKAVSSVVQLLDKAKVVHNLPSDYKLALVMGISHSALISYRTGKTLPDTRVIGKICDLTGDDPALLAVQVEEERAKTDEARAIWHAVAMRLQLAARAGVAAAIFAVTVSLGLLGVFYSENASAQTVRPAFTKIYIVESRARRKRRFSWDVLSFLLSILRRPIRPGAYINDALHA